MTKNPDDGQNFFASLKVGLTSFVGCRNNCTFLVPYLCSQISVKLRSTNTRRNVPDAYRIIKSILPAKWDENP